MSKGLKMTVDPRPIDRTNETAHTIMLLADYIPTLKDGIRFEPSLYLKDEMNPKRV